VFDPPAYHSPPTPFFLRCVPSPRPFHCGRCHVSDSLFIPPPSFLRIFGPTLFLSESRNVFCALLPRHSQFVLFFRPQLLEFSFWPPFLRQPPSPPSSTADLSILASPSSSVSNVLSRLPFPLKNLCVCVPSHRPILVELAARFYVFAAFFGTEKGTIEVAVSLSPQSV